MKKCLLVLGCLSIAACGSSGGSSAPSFSEMKAKFDKPTGVMKTDNAAGVADGLAAKMKSGISKPGALTAALEAITGALASATIDCSNISVPSGYTGGTFTATCKCNGGGTVGFTMDPTQAQGGNPVSVAYTYNNCAMTENGSTTTINGTGYYVPGPKGSTEMFYSFKGSVKTADQTVTMDVEYYFDGKDYWYLVTVTGVNGDFVCKGSYDSTTKSGTWTVKDSSGTYECTATNGKGTCTGAGGATVTW